MGDNGYREAPVLRLVGVTAAPPRARKHDEALN
jgi:hypothetical protein